MLMKKKQWLIRLDEMKFLLMIYRIYFPDEIERSEEGLKNFVSKIDLEIWERNFLVNGIFWTQA